MVLSLRQVEGKEKDPPKKCQEPAKKGKILLKIIFWYIRSELRPGTRAVKSITG